MKKSNFIYGWICSHSAKCSLVRTNDGIVKSAAVGQTVMERSIREVKRHGEFAYRFRRVVSMGSQNA